MTGAPFRVKQVVERCSNKSVAIAGSQWDPARADKEGEK